MDEIFSQRHRGEDFYRADVGIAYVLFYSKKGAYRFAHSRSFLR